MKWRSYIAQSGEKWLKSKRFKRYILNTYIPTQGKNRKELIDILQVPDELFEDTDLLITIVAHKRKPK